MPLTAGVPALHCPIAVPCHMDVDAHAAMRPVPVKKATPSLAANVGPNASHSKLGAESGEAD